MLQSLTIRDFVIVDRIELDFKSGFTALTGETGAGKSILIDALSLILGERAEANTVRTGSERAEIIAEFDIKNLRSFNEWLSANDLQADEDVCLMRRIVDTSGRSRAYINGSACTLQQMREAGEFLIDIHGQHMHQSLSRTQTQRELLDAYAGAVQQADNVALAYKRWQDFRQRRIARETNAAAFAAERTQLEYQINELEAIQFSLEEWGTLQAEHSRLNHAASLIDTAQYSIEILSEADGAALAQLNTVLSRVRDAVEYDPALKDVLETLEPAQIQVQEAVYALRHYQQSLDLDPQRLAQAEQRLAAIHSAARKYRVTPHELPELLSRFKTRLNDLGGDADDETLIKQEEQAQEEYQASAKNLSKQRKRAAKELSDKVTRAMQSLAMEGGRFEIDLAPLAEGNGNAHGLEQIIFKVSSHEGISSGPLAKVASGGELSRISLAIQTVTNQVSNVPTLIFDEVDVGIGGRVAEIVGRLLKDLSKQHQVLCVTHLPQVAANAHQQWQVSKITQDKKVLSQVTVLSKAQRIEEIARMLGGVKITATTRKHAQEMLSMQSSD